MAPTPTPTSTDLTQLLQQHGIDPSKVGSSTTSTRNQPTTIWLGQSTVSVPSGWKSRGPNGGAPHVYGPQTRKVQRTDTVESMMRDFYRWPATKIAGLKSQLIAAGVLDASAGIAEVAAEYEKALKMAATMYAAGRKITPNEIISGWLGGNLGGVPSKPLTMTQTQQSVDLTDPDSANALLIQSLQNALGRDPDAAEKNAFLAALHKHERANPTITNSKYKLDPATGQYTLVDQQQTGGSNAQSFAAEYGQEFDPKEAGAYQASTTFFNALISALGATTSAGAGTTG